MNPQSFSSAVIEWQQRCGRNDLPWQNTQDPYRIWLSEIMLQQTQVGTVIPYYQRFVQRFPHVFALAAASHEAVMSHWSGLGYYTRARNLHRCAQTLVAHYGGYFPTNPCQLEALPGIGRTTAAAIAAFAYGQRAAILDGNVKRVLARVFGIDAYPGLPHVEKALWQRAESLLPEKNVEAYTQGLMDLGATLCTRNKPVCSSTVNAPTCPLHQQCIALKTQRVTELPIRKPKKVLPEKQTDMLIIVNHSAEVVLLEQRPHKGIWGGLLSLPEMKVHDAHVTKQSTLGIIASIQALPVFSHSFTHYKLHIAPFYIVLKQGKQWLTCIEEKNTQVWYDIKTLDHAPLPAPVKTLLLDLFTR